MRTLEAEEQTTVKNIVEVEESNKEKTGRRLQRYQKELGKDCKSC